MIRIKTLNFFFLKFSLHTIHTQKGLFELLSEYNLSKWIVDDGKKDLIELGALEKIAPPKDIRCREEETSLSMGIPSVFSVWKPRYLEITLETLSVI